MRYQTTDKHPQVFKSLMNTASHFITTKKIGPFELSSESNEAPYVELTTALAPSGSWGKKVDPVVELARHCYDPHKGSVFLFSPLTQCVYEYTIALNL